MGMKGKLMLSSLAILSLSAEHLDVTYQTTQHEILTPDKLDTLFLARLALVIVRQSAELSSFDYEYTPLFL
jgi:hypothetical protein